MGGWHGVEVGVQEAMRLSRRMDCGRLQSSTKAHQAQRLLCPGRGRVWVSQQGRGDYLMFSVWKTEEEEEGERVGGGVARGFMRGGEDVEEIAGRKAFHFVMVLVGLEASIAAKREQDYLIAYPSSGSFVGGVLFSPAHLLQLQARPFLFIIQISPMVLVVFHIIYIYFVHFVFLQYTFVLWNVPSLIAGACLFHGAR